VDANKPPLNACGPTIRRLRYERKWSQATLALKCQLAGWDISRDIIASMELRRRLLTDLDLQRFAKVFRVPVEQLFPRR